jgi:hypothetical protein
VAYAINGKLVTGTHTRLASFTSPSVFGIESANGEEQTQHQQMLSCATTDLISNAELIELSKNPWSIFKPTTRSINTTSESTTPTTIFAQLFSSINELYYHTVSIWQNSVTKYLSNLRNKVVTATTKAKLFNSATKSVSLVSSSRTKVFTPETKSKTFTTTTRG